MSKTPTNTDSSPGSSHPMQPACPAFTRWMQRRIFRNTAPTKAPSRTFASQLAPNAEELHVAELQDLRQRLRCQDPFLQHVMTGLLKELVVTHTWLTPLPRTRRSSSTESAGVGFGASGGCRQHTGLAVDSTPDPVADASQSVTWVRPFDDIWAIAIQAVRDPNLARHETGLVFVVTLVQSLLTPTGFCSGHTHEDLNLLQHIKAARRACSDEGVSDDCVSEYETKRLSNGAQMEAQAVLLKALLIPDMTDVSAENIHLLQLNRIRRTVGRAMQALQQAWAPAEGYRSTNRSCQPHRSPVSQCATQPTRHSTQRPPVVPPKRGGAR